MSITRRAIASKFLRELYEIERSSYSALACPTACRMCFQPERTSFSVWPNVSAGRSHQHESVCATISDIEPDHRGCASSPIHLSAGLWASTVAQYELSA